jgi:hypothetical protein
VLEKICCNSYWSDAACEQVFGRGATAATTCTFCEVGKFNPESKASSCKSCSSFVGQTSVIDSPVGSTTVADCEGYCTEGTEFNLTSKSCRSCPVGKYKYKSVNVSNMLEGFNKCLECTAHRQNSFTEKAGSTSKEACKCNAGYFGEILCEGCPAGKYKV